MCLNFTSIILIIQILHFSLGSQVQNLFSYTNRGSKTDYGRMPYLYRFENKNKIYAFDRCFSPQYTVFKQCPYASHSLVKNAFSLDPHNCKTD